MERIHSIDEFYELQKRLEADRDESLPTIVIPAGTCGQASGANDLIRITKRELLSRNLMGRIHLRITGCAGFCEMEPSVLIEPHRTFYPGVSIANMVRIVEAVSEGKVLEDLLYTDVETGRPIEKQEDIPFFKNQLRTILSRNEKVDPIRIFNYIGNGGYSSLTSVLWMGNRQTVIEGIKESSTMLRTLAAHLPILWITLFPARSTILGAEKIGLSVLKSWRILF